MKISLLPKIVRPIKVESFYYSEASRIILFSKESFFDYLPASCIRVDFPNKKILSRKNYFEIIFSGSIYQTCAFHYMHLRAKRLQSKNFPSCMCFAACSESAQYILFPFSGQKSWLAVKNKQIFFSSIIDQPKVVQYQLMEQFRVCII